MDRLELRSLIRKRLGETTAAFWTDVELNGYIDLAGHDVAYKTKCIKANDYITTDGTGEYTMSDTFPLWLSILRVYLKESGNTWIKIDQTNEDDLDRYNDGWRSAPSSQPYQYYQDKERDLLALYPKANTANQGTDYLRVFICRDYTDITVDDVDLATGSYMPFKTQLAMADFVVATGYETRGWGDKANDAWTKYAKNTGVYMVERDTEKQEDEEALLMKNYRNV